MVVTGGGTEEASCNDAATGLSIRRLMLHDGTKLKLTNVGGLDFPLFLSLVLADDGSVAVVVLPSGVVGQGCSCCGCTGKFVECGRSLLPSILFKIKNLGGFERTGGVKKEKSIAMIFFIYF